MPQITLPARRRTNYRRIVLAVFRAKGPLLSDAELAWWVRVAIKGNPASAKKARRDLTVDGAIRFARQVRITKSGRVHKLWEITDVRKGVPLCPMN
jgi:hypothetical protein